jgi:hypothetical protein
MTIESQEKESMLVLCQTLLNDAFLCYSGDNWRDAYFIINFLIIKKADLESFQYPAITSTKIFNTFIEKFYKQITNPIAYETLQVLEDCIFINKNPDIEKLSGDEDILTIAETLYSHGDYKPVLVSSKADKINTVSGKSHVL